MSPSSSKPPKEAFIRRVALSLPGTSESYYKGPRFGIGKKAFLHGWTGETLWLFKLPHHQEMMLFEARPHIFTPMRSGAMLWCHADVEQLDAAELRDLIEAAWRTVAPKTLQKGFA
ncbi:MAG TPA: MmcQ/YjbR family DNA-binding protein [Rhizomicrobium sp.]|nr:MmcQ/YjbR family DNA-binding protein [Rhizomicrobium sp.]